MGRTPAPVEMAVKGIKAPKSLTEPLKKVKNINDKTITFWVSLLPDSERVAAEKELKLLAAYHRPKKKVKL